MSFQILNPKGIAIAINELDKEAAAFWDKELHPNEYANPIKIDESASKIDQLRQSMAGNWFDVIGYAIHSQGDYTKSWDNVKCTLWTVQAQGMYAVLYDENKLMLTIEGARIFLKPYFDLIDHWESKGYKPLQIKE